MILGWSSAKGVLTVLVSFIKAAPDAPKKKVKQ